MSRQGQIKVKTSRSEQVHGKVKAMSRRGLGKVKTRSRIGQEKISRQGHGKINARLNKKKHNHNHNVNLIGFDTVEMNLVACIMKVFNLFKFSRDIRRTNEMRTYRSPLFLLQPIEVIIQTFPNIKYANNNLS